MLALHSSNSYPSAKNLVDGSRLFESALCNNLGPHLFHVEHECIERFLDVVLPNWFLGLPGSRRSHRAAWGADGQCWRPKGKKGFLNRDHFSIIVGMYTKHS